MFRLTRREQLVVVGLCLTIFLGAVVKHFRETLPRLAHRESK
jgi:hypothetical protein